MLAHVVVDALALMPPSPRVPLRTHCCLSLLSPSLAEVLTRKGCVGSNTVGSASPCSATSRGICTGGQQQVGAQGHRSIAFKTRH